MSLVLYLIAACENSSTLFAISYVKFILQVIIVVPSIMLQGAYKEGDSAFDAKNLTCDVSYTVNMDEEEKDTYCNISKLELLSFLEDINNFTDDKDIKSIVDKGISHK